MHNGSIHDCSCDQCASYRASHERQFDQMEDLLQRLDDIREKCYKQLTLEELVQFAVDTLNDRYAG